MCISVFLLLSLATLVQCETCTNTMKGSTEVSECDNGCCYNSAVFEQTVSDQYICQSDTNTCKFYTTSTNDEVITIDGDFKTKWWSVLMIAVAVIIIAGILSILLFVCVYQLQNGNLITPSPSPDKLKFNVMEERSRSSIEREERDIEAARLANVQADERERKAKQVRLEKVSVAKNDLLMMWLDRPLVAELKSFLEPPPAIHKTMIASFVIMGEPKEKMLQWNEVVILLNKTGKRSLRNRVLNVEVDKVPVAVCRRARAEVQGVDPYSIDSISRPAAMFYNWVDMICIARLSDPQSTNHQMPQ